VPDSRKNISLETKLVIAVKQGNKEAFKDLYFRYYDQLYRFAWYRTQSEDLSREYLQELFTRVWEKRKRLKPDKSIKAYLYRSLSNLMIDAARLHSSQNLPIDHFNSRSNQQDLDLHIDIQSAINNLPQKLKDVYLLSRYDGFKYIEIAEICAISVKAVEKRMTKAFTILRKAFPKKYFS